MLLREFLSGNAIIIDVWSDLVNYRACMLSVSIGHPLLIAQAATFFHAHFRQCTIANQLG